MITAEADGLSDRGLRIGKNQFATVREALCQSHGGILEKLKGHGYVVIGLLHGVLTSFLSWASI